MKLRPGVHARGLVDAFRRSPAIAIGVVAILWAAPSFAQAGGCPASNALQNFVVDPNVAADFTISTTTNSNDTATYTFTSNSEGTVLGGIPGLIEYCVYPSQPPGNPTVATPLYSDAGGTWNAVFGSIQGFFAFKRYDGDPSNIPIDGTTYTVGSAIWPVPSSCSPVGYAGCPGAPTTQTILLHVSDPTECSLLYTAGTASCFVFPGLEHGPPNPHVCNGAPACKDVVVDQAITVDPLTVPGKQRLNLHYTYTIINQPTNTFDMVFYPPTSSTQDINTGGGKDYFGCEQIPDPAGVPGSFSPPIFANYQGTGFNLNFIQKSGTCNQSYFYLQVPGPNAIVLTPGESITFTIDMITRTNKGGNQEFTSCGRHLLNSGFTVKWFEIPDGSTVPPIKKAGQLFSYSTNIDPIYVNVVNLPGCQLPPS
jgi:hypothetical protein